MIHIVFRTLAHNIRILLLLGICIAPYSVAKLPDYFLLSFLDLSEDLSEAQSQNKHLMLYFHQEGCPYCLAMEQEVFPDPQVDALMRENFLAIELNIWGDRNVTLADGREISEKVIARELGVQFTPIILLLSGIDLANPDNQLARINGYRKAESFAHSVQAALDNARQAPIRHTPLLATSYSFSNPNVLANPKAGTPIALFFEQGECADCAHMHSLLQKPRIAKLLGQYHRVRLHAADSTPINLGGKVTNPSQLAKRWKINYYPSVLLFDLDQQGRLIERLRMDSHLKAFHFATALDYVAQKIYLEDNNFQNHINARGQQLRDSGVDVRVWE